MDVATAAETAVRCRGLVKRYDGNVAVRGIDLDVHRGEVFAFLGPNGAGKTTTIEILEGLTSPDAGEVELLGTTWDREPQRLRERIGISLQETQLNEKLTVEETLRLFRSFYAHGRDPDLVIADLSLEEKRRARVGKLSGGQKQRLAVGCALVGGVEAFEDLDRRGLAGAVGAEQAEAFARPHGQIEPIDRADVFVVPGQPAAFDRKRRHALSMVGTGF